MSMIEKAIIISLMITAIHVSMWDGMIFGKLREWLNGVLSIMGARWLAQPLYECNICMGGIWTLVLYPILFGWDIWLIAVMLMVIGLNVLVACAIKYLRGDECE